MLLIFVIVILVLLHVQFYVRNILFGTDEVNFFTFTIRYIFDRDVSINSLYFSVSCTVAFAIGYLIAHRGRAHRLAWHPNVAPPYSLPMWPLIAAGVLQILASLQIAIESGFAYQF